MGIAATLLHALGLDSPVIADKCLVYFDDPAIYAKLIKIV